MTDITDDPFAAVEAAAPEEKTAPKKAAPAKAKKEETVEVSTQVIDFSNFIAEMTIGDDDFELPASIIPYYIKPAEHTWVPVRITSAVVEQKERRAVVATAPDGTIVTTPKVIDMAVEKGCPESVEDGLTMWQFVVTAEHVLTCFGVRKQDYRLYASVFPIRVPYRKPKMQNGVELLGFDSYSGKKLMIATRTLNSGDRLTEENAERLEEIASSMVGRIVMARIRHREVTSTVPRKNPNGSFVKARINEDDGSFIKLEKKGDAFVDSSGSKCETNEDGDVIYIPSEGPAAIFPPKQLIPFGAYYLIPDNSEDGAVVKDNVENVYDNLADEVGPVPGRIATIRRQDETEVEAEVTWETTGFIATAPVRAGTMIQAVSKGGELITASWLGTHWEEVDPHELTVGDDGKMRLVSATSLAGGAAAGAQGLDVFKGDTPA